MASHASSCSASASLCQELFDSLNKKIPNLKYNQGKNKCSIGVIGGRKIFAWVNSHGYHKAKIEIWFLGDLNKVRGFRHLEIRPRSPTEGSWSEYKARFEIFNRQQLEDAVELLSTVSYPVSI